MSSYVPSEAAKKACLERVLASAEFSQADRMQQLLRFLGDAEGPVKETVIGVEVFGREPGYDPKIDSVVRTEVRRLRLKLQEYYAGPGAVDPYRIEIPKGAYQLTFVETATAVVSEPVAQTPAPKPKVAPGAWMAIATAAVLCSSVGGLLLWRGVTADSRGDSGSPVAEPRLLTSSIGQATQPSLSQNGEIVAYAYSYGENSGIYTMRMDGRSTPQRLAGTRARDYNPALDPAGTSVAFLREESPNQFAILVQGLQDQEARRFATIDRRDRVAWLPDGKRLIVSGRLNPAGPAVLAMIDANGARTVLTTPPPGTLVDGLPALSPDAKTLAFVRSTDVSIDDLYTVELGPDFLPRTEPRRVTNEKRRFGGFCFAPDGKSILASLQRGRSVRGIWRIPLDQPERLERVAEAGILATYPTVSVATGRVVYSIGVDDLNLYRVHDGVTTPVSPSTTLDSAPAISPDGTEVAFRSARAGSSEIWVAKIDGTQPRRLTFVDGPVTGSPRWSPDGKSIAYDTRLDGHADVYIMQADGKNPRRITSQASNEVVPAWSGDGKFLYYASDQTGSWELWKIAVDGSGGVARQITTAGGFRAQESADGKWLYYSKREPKSGLWRVRLDAPGGPEEEVLPLAASLWGGWALSASGVYYLDPAKKPPEILYKSLLPGGGGKQRDAIRLRNLPVQWEPSLAVTLDERELVYTQLDSAISDLYRIDLKR